MAWTIDYTDTGKLRRPGKQAARRILDYMDERITEAKDPRDAGKALKWPLGDLRRCCVGEYRIICDIQDGRLNGGPYGNQIRRVRNNPVV